MISTEAVFVDRELETERPPHVLAFEGLPRPAPMRLISDRHFPDVLASRLYGALSDRPDGVIPGTERWTGQGMAMGSGTVFNTFGASVQLVTFLSLSPKIPPLLARGISNVGALCDAQVLEGFSAVDCGCGRLPTFARAARAMGAQVWTVDLMESGQFIGNKGAFAAEDAKYHLVGDFGTFGVWDRLRKLIPGQVHFVTHSHTAIATGMPRGVLPPDSWGNSDCDSPMAEISEGAPNPVFLKPLLLRDGVYLTVEGHESRLLRKYAL